jgi:protein SCO1/2
MRILLASAVFAVAVLAGCHAGSKTSAQSSAAPAFKVYHLRGKVVSTNPAAGEITVNHEAVPGYMEAMTMPYKLKDSSVLGQLHPGDTITADMLVPSNAGDDLLLDRLVVVAQAKPGVKP